MERSDDRSPVVQAEQARQVVGVLTRIEQRFAAAGWARGARFGGSGTCLIGGIDETTRWTLPGVAEQVTGELAQRLPAGLRAVARVRPRLALAVYNDMIGGQDGALALVHRTRTELGGLPLAAVPAAAPAVLTLPEARRSTPTSG